MMTRRLQRTGTAGTMVLTVVILFGCGGGGGGGNGDGDLIFPATLVSIQDNIFTPRCANGCHEPGGEGVALTQPTAQVPDGVPLDLSTKDAAYNSLLGPDDLGRESVQSKCGTNDDEHCGLRVDPGNPDDSYIIHKLEGTDVSFGTDRMPRLGCCLTQDEVDVIRQWISDGALDD